MLVVDVGWAYGRVVIAFKKECEIKVSKYCNKNF